MTNQHTALPMPERFWSHVIRWDADCWTWVGPHQSIGYAIFGKTVAHRVAYELSVGPVPAGMELDHLCRNRGCVNPAHLEPVTRRENVMRSDSFAAVNAAKTHCPNGHPYSGGNLHVRPNGDRRCRTCVKAANDRRYARLAPGSAQEAE